MVQRFFAVLVVCCCARSACAQDLSNIQIHGFVTQGFLYSTNNNFFTMDTNTGSARWTDGAISISDAITDKLRVGIQLHMDEMGQFGSSPNIQVDWATGDYKVNEHLGFRGGKVKTAYGLFNDSQDVDAAHLWVLLPQSFYPVDNKSFLLSHLGGDVYGGFSLGKKAGSLLYRGYVGYRDLDLHGGYVLQISESTGPMSTAPSGKMYGGDLRWHTPIKGTVVGVSAIVSNSDGVGSAGKFHIPYFTGPVMYAKYEKGKFLVAGEYKRTNLALDLTLTGVPFPVTIAVDTQSWYAMGSYRLLDKLQVGSYYSHQINRLGDETQPANFSKDWDISGRYDINAYFYTKIECHFVNGTELGYYPVNNPAGEKPKTTLLAAKLGFNF